MSAWAATSFVAVKAMSRGISKRTKKLTLGAMLAAIGTVLLFVGSYFQVLDLSMAAIASFVCVIAVIELGTAWSWGVYAVAGLIALRLNPQSFAPWVFIAFLGYYPIIKEKIERLRAPLAWLIKILCFNAAVIACCALAYYTFASGLASNFIEFFNVMLGFNSAAYAVAGALLVFMNVVFVIYDLALTRLISLYMFRLRSKLRFLNINK